MNYILTIFAVLALIGFLFVVFATFFAVEAPTNRHKLKEGDRIKLPFDMIALLGGIEDGNKQVLVKSWYRLIFYKETEDRYYFQAVFNDEQKTVLKTKQIVSFTKTSFVCLAYKIIN